MKDDVTETETYFPLIPEFGSYTIEQKMPCVEDDDACRDSFDPHQSRKFIFKSCQSERQAEFKEYWETRRGKKESVFTGSALCLAPEDEDTLQIGEDPSSKIEASTLKLGFEYCLELEEDGFSTSETACKSKDETNEWLRSSELDL